MEYNFKNQPNHMHYSNPMDLLEDQAKWSEGIKKELREMKEKGERYIVTGEDEFEFPKYFCYYRGNICISIKEILGE